MERTWTHALRVPSKTDIVPKFSSCPLRINRIFLKKMSLWQLQVKHPTCYEWVFGTFDSYHKDEIMGKLMSSSLFIWPVPFLTTQSVEIDALQFRFTGWYFITFLFLCYWVFFSNRLVSLFLFFCFCFQRKLIMENCLNSKFRSVVIEKVVIKGNLEGSMENFKIAIKSLLGSDDIIGELGWI